MTDILDYTGVITLSMKAPSFRVCLQRSMSLTSTTLCSWSSQLQHIHCHYCYCPEFRIMLMYCDDNMLMHEASYSSISSSLFFYLIESVPVLLSLRTNSRVFFSFSSSAVSATRCSKPCKACWDTYHNLEYYWDFCTQWSDKHTYNAPLYLPSLLKLSEGELNIF